LVLGCSLKASMISYLMRGGVIVASFFGQMLTVCLSFLVQTPTPCLDLAPTPSLESTAKHQPPAIENLTKPDTHLNGGGARSRQGVGVWTRKDKHTVSICPKKEATITPPLIR
jgi:hypothetical protein